ncbi:ABC transporter permease [Cellulomonas sp.]|uniref:ABC transporter permease n=1 Tax=Cellulomonas sp. TaxID=40001 RepID=UPI001B116DB2|nr:ABC transporter permease [Cellulomonas sp.]MBO9553862.1 ABC transporter permease [Cellulomonas sp.]
MSHHTGPHTPWRRLLGVAVALTALATVLVLAFLWPAHTSEPRDLPVAVAGPAAATAPLTAALEQRAPGAFDVVPAADRQAAADLVETRDVYGAIVLGPEPEVLVSTASSAVVAQQFSALAPVLQAQLTEAAGAPVAVAVTDVVPLGAGDPRGAVIGAVTLPLVMGGMIGGIAISLTVVGVWRRVAAVTTYAALAGLAVAGVLQGWYGALAGSFAVNAGIIGLGVLAVAGVIVGVVSILGRPGIAIGPVLFLLVANPLASAAQPWQMLPAPWGAIGQWMPPGAAAALLRDESYFPRADTGQLWTALVAWAVLGLVLATVGHFRDAGAASRAAVAEAEADRDRETHEDARPSITVDA